MGGWRGRPAGVALSVDRRVRARRRPRLRLSGAGRGAAGQPDRPSAGALARRAGLRALATGETAAEASGVPVGAYRLLVFAVSAAFAGLAGGIYSFFLGYLAPGSFPVLLSIEYVVMAVVGGLGSIGGALLGAALITVVVQLLTTLATQPGMPSYAPSVLSYAVYALLLIAVVLFVPKGIVPTLRRSS
ncbi:branched-chain amino acid ABC transporter permease [Paractinoplanes durhamensis]|uniref:branched-chain amino acid ABC transporter permease n=1 Tax=Paractinoplanes durhamensis TaxID=113563 RepID=UPI00363EA834